MLSQEAKPMPKDAPESKKAEPKNAPSATKEIWPGVLPFPGLMPFPNVLPPPGSAFTPQQLPQVLLPDPRSQPQRQGPAAIKPVAAHNWESNVSLLDYAAPMNLMRLRVDSFYRIERPSRGEYLFAATEPDGGRGFRLREREIRGYQELTARMEYLLYPMLSIHVDVPWRWVDPVLNNNFNGPGDLIAGFKIGLFNERDWMLTFMNKFHLSSGQASTGLGRGHVSLEPGLLANWHMGDQWILEAQSSLWIPTGAPDFGSTIFRYGLGLSYGLHHEGQFWAAPVAEVLGWTLLNGNEVLFTEVNSTKKVRLAGDTILQAGLGFRAGYGNAWDMFFGYSAPMITDEWSKNQFRVEFRCSY